MDGENKRRSFLKHLFSLIAFGAGSVFSYKGNRGLGIGKFGSINVGPLEARAMDAGGRVKKIAVEEHATEQTIKNLDERLKDMDEAGIDMQVISQVLLNLDDYTTPELVDLNKRTNDNLSKVAEKYPDRFACYTSLPMQDPDAAARELERAVKELGLKGPLIYAGHDGSYLDEKKFWGIYETAEKLDVPVYVHPGGLLPDMSKPYMAYPIMSQAMWGFAASTGLHAMRLILSGVFDKYPGLKIMLGHLGEAIPFWMWRIDKHYVTDRSTTEKDAPGTNLKKQPSQYFSDNFYVTTSGMFWPPVLQFVLSVLGSDRVLFAADYPPESALEASQFIDAMPLSSEDKEKVCHLNAEKLLRI